MRERVSFTIDLTDGDIELIAGRAAALVIARLPPPRAASPYLTVREAAELLRARPQRVHDLLCQRRLTRVKDGGRTLVLRAELEAHLRGEQTGDWTLVG